MLLEWRGLSKTVKTVDGQRMMTSHGPALITDGNSLQIIYVDENGKNLRSVLTFPAIFPAWDGDLRIDEGWTVPGNSVPLTAYRPALAFFKRQFHMVYIGKRSKMLCWAWCLPNAEWRSVQLPWYADEDTSPCLAVHTDGRLYLAWCEPGTAHKSVIKYSFLDPKKPNKAWSWARDWIAGTSACLPAMVSYGGDLIMLARTCDRIGEQSRLLIARLTKSEWSNFADFGIAGEPIFSSGAPAAAVLNDRLYVVYRDQSGLTLRYAWVDNTMMSHGDIGIIPASGNAPETGAPIALAAFDGKLCFVFRGAGKHQSHLCFGYGTALDDLQQFDASREIQSNRAMVSI